MDQIPGLPALRQSGVMGVLEPQAVPCHELGIVIEAVAGTQADAVCSFARSTMLHTSYPGRLTTAGKPVRLAC